MKKLKIEYTDIDNNENLDLIDLVDSAIFNQVCKNCKTPAYICKDCILSNLEELFGGYNSYVDIIKERE